MALQKNKREICKDKQILMISRFYKPAFRSIIIFFGYIINEKEEKMQKTILSIKEKYGKNAVFRGMSLQENATQRMRNGLIGGHKSGEEEQQS